MICQLLFQQSLITLSFSPLRSSPLQLWRCHARLLRAFRHAVSNLRSASTLRFDIGRALRYWEACCSYTQYYPRGDATCNSSSLSATIVHEEGRCFNLDHPAKSFHIGGPGTEVQVPKGCTIKGYADKGCKGALNLEIVGKSSGKKCYTTGAFMGNMPPAKSIVLDCE